MADQCPLCERPRESAFEFCSLHEAALRSLDDAYHAWNRGYNGKLSRKEYLAKVASLPETGQTVKEVIQHIQAQGAVT